MTAALTADAAGLDTLVVEKSPQFGGSTALSGGGIWVPGAPVAAPGRLHARIPTACSSTCKHDHRRTGQRRAAARIRRRGAGDDGVPGEVQHVVRVRLEARLRRLLPGTARRLRRRAARSTCPPSTCASSATRSSNLLTPLALAPKGIWFAPKDLRLFYQVRQNWRGKAVLLKLIWRMFRARVFGDRMAAIGQSLVARMRLAMKEHGIPLWLDAPMTELITDADGAVIGAVVERDGRRCAIGPARGVVLATGGFDHDMAWRREHLPVLEKDWSFGNPAATGDGIRAGEKVGAATELLDEAWWFPAMCWPDGRLQFMLNERMMPSQFVVNGAGKRFINEAAPYMDFAHAMIEGQQIGRRRTSRAGWSPTSGSFHRYVVGGHLPHPEDPVRAGADRAQGARRPGWTRAWSKTAHSFEELASKIGVPAGELRQHRRAVQRAGPQRATTTTSTAVTAPTTTTTATRRCPTRTCIRWASRPYYAFQIILGDLGTSGGLRTDEYARVLRDDDTAIAGLYAMGNTSAAVMGRSYAGAGATIGPAMTFGYVAAKHIAGQPNQTTVRHDSTPHSIPSEVKHEDFAVLRVPAAAAVVGGRRAPAVPARSGRGRGRRQGRLLHGLAHRAPLPRGVLPLDRAGDVPGRGEPAHQGHPARASVSCTCRRRSTTRPASPSASRRWTTCPTAAWSSAPARGRRSPSSVGSTSTRPTSARSGRRRSRSSIRCMTEEPFTGFKGEHVEMPARNVIPKPLQKPHPPVWVACTRPSSVQMAAQKAIGALSFAYTGPEAAQGSGRRLLQGIRGEGRARHAGDQPQHPGHRRRPVDDGRQEPTTRRSSGSASAAASSRSASCTTT